jgi:predicted regulator of Ras-like GTPase activity (Roadblock/LC7/MglB family)
MASIRELVEAIRARSGVEAAVVLGRDGLLIDGHAQQGVDAEDLAARIPSVVSPADEIGTAFGRGALTTAVLEYEQGYTVIASMSDEALLVVLLRPDADLAPLLHELRRNRQHLAALV